MEHGGVSRREAEVLVLVGEQLSNAQIAHRLRLSVRTVEHHVASLLRKHSVMDRRQLAALAPQSELPGLPNVDTSFVGRGHERDTGKLLLSTARLVTLVGPGGVGKTRLAGVLAAECARQFPRGGAFVDLVPVRDDAVAQAVAAGLGVAEVPHRSLLDAIVTRLQSGPTLLVLDNCEHLLDAVSEFIQRVLSACPETSILTTSRERLGVPGERALPLAPLRLASEAEELFLDRARAADPGFTAEHSVVAEICGRLDGVPLAIELAAARSAAMGATGLLAALDDHLQVLSGRRDTDVRHRSLRAVIDWSYALLDDEERALFRRLSVFAGAFDLPAAAAIGAADDRAVVADLLGRLTDKSLLGRLNGPVSRWRLLATICAYAAEQLAQSGDHDNALARHRGWAKQTALAIESNLDGAWRDEFDAVADDLRAALALAPDGPDPTAHSLARSLGRLTYARRFLTEALEHFRHAAERAPSHSLAAHDLRIASDAVYSFGHAGQAYDLLLASAERARAGGDGNGEAIALARAVETATRLPSGFTEEVPYERLRSLMTRAAGVGDVTDPLVAAHLAAARAWSANPAKLDPDPRLAEEAVAAARATGSPLLVSAALDAVDHLAARAGHHREAYRVARERLDLLSSLDRNDPASATELLDVYHAATTFALATGDVRGALAVAERIREDDLFATHPYRATCKLVAPLVLLGRFQQALEAAEVMWEGWERAGAPVAAWMSPAVSAVALAHGLLDDRGGYELWSARADRAAGRVTNPDAYARNNFAFATFVHARVALHTGDLTEAQALARLDFTAGRYEGYARTAVAELAVVAGLPEALGLLEAAEPAAAENDWAAACLARARGRVAESVGLWERIGAEFEREFTFRKVI